MVAAQLTQLNIAWELLAQQRLGSLGEQHLPPMRGHEQPCGREEACGAEQEEHRDLPDGAEQVPGEGQESDASDHQQDRPGRKPPDRRRPLGTGPRVQAEEPAERRRG